jgi:hypothetical protein
MTGNDTTLSFLVERGVVLTSFLPRLVSNLDPPDLYLLSSWDYRRESPHPTTFTTHLNLHLLHFECPKVTNLERAQLGLRLSHLF